MYVKYLMVSAMPLFIKAQSSNQGQPNHSILYPTIGCR